MLLLRVVRHVHQLFFLWYFMHFNKKHYLICLFNYVIYLFLIDCLIFPHFLKSKTMTNKTALIIASDGSEDIELIVTSDVLRRAGINVTIAGLQDRAQIELARKAKLQVDALFRDVLDKQYDAVVLPGGQPGSDNLAADPRVGTVLRAHEKAGAIVAAICAAPIAFVAHQIGVGGMLTSYPSVQKKITDAGYAYTDQHNVCVHKNVVTSRGPGTAFDFALKLVELLVDIGKADEIRGAMLLN